MLSDVPACDHALQTRQEPDGAPAAWGLVSAMERQAFTELSSPCREFRVVALRISDRLLFEAYRVTGKGSVYSITTTDLDELRAVIYETCRGGCGR